MSNNNFVTTSSLKVGFIGAGNLAQILVKGFISAGISLLHCIIDSVSVQLLCITLKFIHTPSNMVQYGIGL